MTGQDAVRIAAGFHEALGITGVILTKMDGDARGGAALSIYGVTKAPIKYVGVGEKLDALEPFHPERMAGRILQQGDVLTLVEKAQASVDEEEAERLAKKAVSKKGLDLQDFLAAMRQMQKLGPLKNVLGMLPGVNPADAQGGQRGRQAAQARRGDRALDDAEGAGRSRPAQRLAADAGSPRAPAARCRKSISCWRSSSRCRSS